MSRKHLLNDLSFRMDSNFSRPGLIYIKLTEKCNFHCQHCDIWKGDNLTKKELTLDEWKNIIKDVAHFVKNPTITISGGEPLLFPHLDEIINVCKENGVKIALNTNGSLINKEIAQKLVSDPFVKVELSLYSLKPKIHNSMRNTPLAFERTYQGLRYLVEAKKQNTTSKTELLVALLLTSLNLEDAPKIVKHLSQMKVWTTIQSLDSNIQQLDSKQSFGEEAELRTNNLWIKNHQEVSKIFEQIINLKKKGYLIYNRLEQLKTMKEYYQGNFEDIKKINCQSAHNNLIISSEGNAFFCFKGPCLGNLLQNNITNLWSSEKAKEIRIKTKNCQHLCRIMNCNYNSSLTGKIRQKLGR